MESTNIPALIGLILLPLLAVPFIARLYHKWIGAHLTVAEKLPGIDGMRAWLTSGNVFCAVLIPVCISINFGYSPLAMGSLTFGLLLAYPLLNFAASQSQPGPAVPAEDLSREREKVLQLLEAGKITALESAELLNALACSTPPPAKPTAEINPPRKLVLFGAAMLLVGFFLPWFTFDPNAAMRELTTQLVQNMGRMGGMMNTLPQINSSVGTVQVHAGDLAHGLGWWILALGVGAAVLPFFATNLESSMQKKVILAALGMGVILLIYLLSDSFKYVSVGIVLVFAGYVLEAVGTLKERPSAG